MKKNRMMRLASILLVLVLMTSSVVGGTFAKYVTSANGGDSARVAKWGVLVSVQGSLFSETYKRDDTTPEIPATIQLSVEANENVVAPGTTNEEGITFELKGTPEVAVNVVVDFTNVQDIFLKGSAGGAKDYTVDYKLTNAYTGSHENYYPIVYTLKNGAGDTLVEGTLQEIATAFESISGYYPAGTDLETILEIENDGTTVTSDGKYTLTWVWPFEVNEMNTKLDTSLGQLAAGITDGFATDIVNDSSTVASANITISVTQVD